MQHRLAALVLGGALAFVTPASMGSAETIGMPALPASVAQQVPAIGRLGFDRFAQGQGCTATLIAPNLLLTAAHCASATGESEQTFYAGWMDGSAIEERGTALEIRHPSYRGGDAHSPTHDIAIIVLDAPITSITPLPLAKAHPAQLYGTTLALMGYHAGLPDQPSGRLDCPISRFAVGLLRADCIVISGNSGGPVLRRSADGTWEIVGVVSSRYYAGAVAVELPDWLWEQVETHTVR